MRSVAKDFAVPVSTVQHWVTRAQGKRLDRVDWEDRSSAPKRTRRTKASMERRVLAARKRLKQRSALGEYGAPAIHRELQQQGVQPLPGVRTIGRVLQRHGVLDCRKRVRRPPPPKGWYLPDLAAGQCELDSFDTIEGLAIRRGPHLTVLTGISLHGGLPAAWVEPRVGATFVVQALLEHWAEMGRPAYAQFDNDIRFTGPRQHPDAIGRVVRMCLNLNVTPVFAVPNETGFQASIESLNCRWQAKVWRRFQHRSLRGAHHRSNNYITASRQRHAARIEGAPPRQAIPQRWRLNLQAPPHGRIVYLRRTNDKGSASILGHSFLVDAYWVHRLVRAEVDLDRNVIRFYALRRREPDDQPLLNEVHYRLPHKHFQE
jgi:hypothetical protein